MNTTQHRQVTVDELKQHCKKNDCWIAVHNKVYDVSHFHNKHPGEGINDEYIHFHGGKDVTDLFEKYHCTDEPFAWLEQSEQGKLPEVIFIGTLKK